MAYSDYVEGTQLDLSGVVVVFCNTFITWYFPVVSPLLVIPAIVDRFQLQTKTATKVT